VRGPVERGLRANAQLAVVAQVRETRCQPKVGFRGQTRRNERLRVVKLNVRHHLDQRTANVEPFDEVIEVPDRIFELKIADNVAVRRPLNSAGVAGFRLQKLQLLRLFGRPAEDGEGNLSA
jgi:hypothetical protein